MHISKRPGIPVRRIFGSLRLSCMSQNFIPPGLIEPLSSLASQSTFCSVLVLWDHVTNTRREAPSGTCELVAPVLVPAP